MEVVHEWCAGLDVSKRDVKACVRASGKRQGSNSNRSAASGESPPSPAAARPTNGFIGAASRGEGDVGGVGATGITKKPFQHLLEGALFELMLVNPVHAKNLPGRKTSVSDAQRLAELGAHGPVRGLFIRPQPIQELRDVTNPHPGEPDQGPRSGDQPAGEGPRRRRVL
jgi:transposase